MCLPELSFGNKYILYIQKITVSYIVPHQLAHIFNVVCHNGMYFPLFLSPFSLNAHCYQYCLFGRFAGDLIVFVPIKLRTQLVKMRV